MQRNRQIKTNCIYNNDDSDDNNNNTFLVVSFQQLEVCKKSSFSEREDENLVYSFITNYCCLFVLLYATEEEVITQI